MRITLLAILMAVSSAVHAENQTTQEDLKFCTSLSGHDSVCTVPKGAEAEVRATLSEDQSEENIKAFKAVNKVRGECVLSFVDSCLKGLRGE